MSDKSESAGTAQWLTLSGGPVYSVLHSPSVGVPRTPTAVLFVPPLGLDDVVSYRARRYWAIRCAEAGFPSLRFDLPGTAESHGDGHRDDLLDLWSAAIDECGRWLLEASGCTRLAVIGIGVGGLLACRALACGARIDDLVLWGTRAAGRASVREMLAFASLVASEYPEDASGPSPEGGLDVNGYLFSHATVEALSELDVARLTLPRSEGRRALLLSRDDLGVDAALATTLEEAGVEVTQSAVRDFSDLMAHPQSVELRRPEATIRRTMKWLGEGSPSGVQAGGTVGPVVEATGSALIPWGAEQVRETVINVDFEAETGTVVISEPEDAGIREPITVLLLNSGACRKTGLHRMWVELARRWSQRGVVTVRLDVGGVGDSSSVNDHGGDERPLVTSRGLIRDEVQRAVNQTLNLLEDRGYGDRFVILGHCSGAYLGFHQALVDSRVRALFGVNQAYAIYDEALHQGQMFDRIIDAARGGLLRRLRQQGVSTIEVRQVSEAVRHRYRPGSRHSPLSHQRREGLRLLDVLRDRGVTLVSLLSREETPWAAVVATLLETPSFQERWPNLTIEELPTRDHVARAIWLQKLIMDRLDVALEDTLAQMRPAVATGSTTE